MKKWRDETNKPTLTTGDIAKHCDVAAHTVSRWIDSGRLRGYRIPGSQDRRVPREAFVEFLKANKMPMNGFEPGPKRILLIGVDSALRETLSQHILERCEAEIAVASSSFEAGICAGRLGPDCVVIDLALGRIEAGQIVQGLRAARPATVFVALNGDEVDDAILSLGFDDYWYRKPFDAALFAERVRRLMDRPMNGKHQNT
jgi:excisionase family DNA binding protein